MRHLILTGACYVDTILSVPNYPGEDDKLRATALQVRRGGNCPNSLEVLQQLPGVGAEIQTYLVTCLPERTSASAAMIAESLGRWETATATAGPSLDLCLYRAGHAHPASSYILRSAATGSRTIVNYSDLPEMTLDEFAGAVDRFAMDHANADRSWWHFEGRMPETTMACIRHLRQVFGSAMSARRDGIVSVEVEKPGRNGLRELAAAADVVFYSKSWAELTVKDQGYTSAKTCLEGEAQAMPQGKLLFCTWGAAGASALDADGLVSVAAPSVPAANIIDAVGAGDTFVAGVLYKLAPSWKPKAQSTDERPDDTLVHDALHFAVTLASRKIQMNGFRGLV